MSHYWAVIGYDRVYATLEFIKDNAGLTGKAIKFFNDEGFLVGTAFPDGSIQR